MGSSQHQKCPQKPSHFPDPKSIKKPSTITQNPSKIRIHINPSQIPKKSIIYITRSQAKDPIPRLGQGIQVRQPEIISQKDIARHW
jgi:hypothetical protein